jgi:3-phenylpropionate/trans-cinnamate dioxygenase ferredoxin reductase subunit
MSDRIAIIGGGVAAAHLVRAYRDAGGDAEVTILSAEAHLPYNRPPLSKGLLRGMLEAEAVFAQPDAFYTEHSVDVRLGTAATAVDSSAKRVVLANGSEVDYSRLVLASGSEPRTLGIPGAELDGVHVFRTLDDALAVREAAASAGRALVVGAGFIGMETAASLRTTGLEVTLIEPAESLFGPLGSPELSHSLEQLYRDRGVEVILGDGVAALHGDGRLEYATTNAGRTIDARLAVVGIGVQPATGYLDGSGIELDRGAVLVDALFASDDPDVFAIGDVAKFYDPITGHRRLIQHWTNATHHGERLGRTLAGDPSPFDQIAYFFTEIFGTKLSLLGDLDRGHDSLITRGSLADGIACFYLADDRLVAALVSPPTPELLDEVKELLRSEARVRDSRLLADVDVPLADVFRSDARVA